MKPIYSVEELANLFGINIYDIADGLIGANCRCISEGKAVNFASWSRPIKRHSNNVTTIIIGGCPDPNPEHVIVNFNDLPESWKKAIAEAEIRENETINGSRVGKWPWGDYETKLLGKLADASIKFWKLYDPGDNSTAPTNQQVVEWLKQQDVAERTAEVIATILRADGLPTGPRK